MPKKSKKSKPVVVKCAVSIPHAGEFMVNIPVTTKDIDASASVLSVEDITVAVTRIAIEKLRVKVTNGREAIKALKK